ncbi:diguanylate cyclase domain-containing protein [Mangrovibacter yixingensis]|uniref:diguanylate cyclase domain-containing protein n=1 Tax=Mangrovibacter yixingensis TaxID=1529639 RepID=UPI001CFA9F65|nr:sensor domain-containing diguanylate cyclase [Mangrovibacter yixingensis]
MRIATITNWAYGITVAFTLISGGALILASRADTAERQAVAQRAALDDLSEQLDKDVYQESDLARDYVIDHDPQDLLAWQQLQVVENKLEIRLEHYRVWGLPDSALDALRKGLVQSDALTLLQHQAIAEKDNGNDHQAVNLLFNREYQQQLVAIDTALTAFYHQVNAEAENVVQQTGKTARQLRTLSEIMVVMTSGLFLLVLGVILRRRLLQPVVKLSDVVSRLAAQDYAAEPPDYRQIDEIGDMAQALRIFRENGLVRQQLEQEREADLARRRLLATMAQRLQACEHRKDIYRVASVFTPEIAPGIGGQLFVQKNASEEMHCVAAWQGMNRDSAPFLPQSCWAIRRGHRHSATLLGPDMRCLHLPEPGEDARHHVCVPLIAHGENIGVMVLRQNDPSAEFPLLYMDLVAETLAQALTSQKLREALQEKALFDSLTGLRNRYYLEDALKNCLSQARQNNQPVSCLMVDIDNFKLLNDKFGHEAGDDVIRQVAATLKRVVGDRGYLWRYGGEEFLILLPELNSMAAKSLACQVLEQVSGINQLPDYHHFGAVTVSVGVSTWPEDAREDQLVSRADEALYHAKHAGRAQVAVASELPPGPDGLEVSG